MSTPTPRLYVRELADGYHNLSHHGKSEAKRSQSECAKLRAELAVERARLDWVMAGRVCMVRHSGGYHVVRLHAPVSRAIIDANMKEDA